MLEEEPRTNPPLEPRRASLAGWKGSYWTSAGAAREAVRDFLRDFRRLKETELRTHLDEVKTHLWRTDPAEKQKSPPSHGTAISSNGLLDDLAPEPDLLNLFITTLDNALLTVRQQEAEAWIIRTLGYCSANSPNLIAHIRNRLRRVSSIEDHHLVAIGNCLRSPSDISAFVKATCRHLSSGILPERNEWLKAIARLLQYREDAAGQLDSDDCRMISRFCLGVLREQINRGNAAMLYRNASLCIVYLLRRRKYDAGYLDPEERLSVETKQVFEAAIDRFEAGRLKVIGGIVDLPHVTQMMIDYIDKRGRGRLWSVGE